MASVAATTTTTTLDDCKSNYAKVANRGENQIVEYNDDGAGNGLTYLNWQAFDVEMVAVRPALIAAAGYGVFAKVDIPGGTVLSDYVGRFYSVAETADKVASPDDNDDYVLRLTSRVGKVTGHIDAIDTSEPGVTSNWTRFINHIPHRSKPNVKFSSTSVVTTRKILAGAELFINYGRHYWSEEEKEVLKNQSKVKWMHMLNVEFAALRRKRKKGTGSKTNRSTTPAKKKAKKRGAKRKRVNDDDDDDDDKGPTTKKKREDN